MKNLIICGSRAFARDLCLHTIDSFCYGTAWDLKGFLDGPVYLNEKKRNICLND